MSESMQRLCIGALTSVPREPWGCGPPALVEPLLVAVSCDICVSSVTSLLGLVEGLVLFSSHCSTLQAGPLALDQVL